MSAPRHFFIDGKRCETSDTHLSPVQIFCIGHGLYDGTLLLLLENGSDDGSDLIISDIVKPIEISGGERFATFPRGTWGG
jgi:hypothetical protein